MRSGWGTVAATALMAVVTACAPEPPDSQQVPPPTIRIGPLTPRNPDRIPAAQRAAIRELAEVVSHDPPQPGAMDMSGGPETTLPLTGVEEATFEQQWAVAQAAVPGLDTPAEARAAGYNRAAVQASGIGVHWVDWALIDKPFDPARPAMLLFDERNGRDDLVAFSYWVHGPRPEGFAGANDLWHQHTNLCIVNGWVDREMAATPQDCAGSFLAGADLWMLHAWVVPGHHNTWGPFAVVNPALCPPVVGTPDTMRCPTG
jgi:hypothetical protein